jgi:hypothetical protein
VRSAYAGRRPAANLGSVPCMSDQGRCDSCGDEDVEVVALHRLYVTPEAWDQEEKVEVVDDVERWCSVCRTHYPHALL